MKWSEKLAKINIFSWNCGAAKNCQSFSKYFLPDFRELFSGQSNRRHSQENIAKALNSRQNQPTFMVDSLEVTAETKNGNNFQKVEFFLAIATTNAINDEEQSKCSLTNERWYHYVKQGGRHYSCEENQIQMSSFK